MPRVTQRTIRKVLLGEEARRILSIDDLLAMPSNEWSAIRGSITDAWRETPRRKLAQCWKCGGGVYISVRAYKDQRLPCFEHFGDADPRCEWFSGLSENPSNARRDQYGGRQESPAHRMFCELIAQLASAEEGVEATVDRYLRPEVGSYGRYPDVLLTRDGHPWFVIEVQLSSTFQPEISDRGSHYQIEGLPLVWAFCDIDPRTETLPQSFRDIVVRHRENVFVLDDAAIAESRRSKQLKLSCYLGKDGSFETSIRVALSELETKQGGLPFFEDRLLPPILARSNDLRRVWYKALQSRREDFGYTSYVNQSFQDAIAFTAKCVPQVNAWLKEERQRDEELSRFVAVMFSIVTAAQKEFRNFASNQPNLKALINAKVGSQPLGRFSYAVGQLLLRTSAREMINENVTRHVKDAMDRFDGELYYPGEPIWDVMEAILPEVFDEEVRCKLAAVGGVPRWATLALPSTPP